MKKKMNTFQNIFTLTWSNVEFDGHEAKFARYFYFLVGFGLQDPKNIAGRRENSSRTLVTF